MNSKKTKSHELIDTKNRLVVARGGGGGRAETGEGSLNVETPNYKVNKSWECNLQQSDCS